MHFKGQWQEFISAEAGSLPSYGNMPVVVISFGGPEGPVHQFVISTNDAWAIIVAVLSALADQEDALAQEILERYFPPKEDLDYK